MSKDVFIDIAAKGIGGRMELLHEPQPTEETGNIVNLLPSQDKKGLATVPKMSTEKELKAELARLRKEYQPFLENHAPKLNSMNERIDIRNFTLNGSESITIPYYGGPVGNAEQIYEAEFNVSDIDESKEAYICFLGADYKAEVHVNGILAGTHEGFFAPFEFNISKHLRKGKNTLKVTLKNDYRFNGNADVDGVIIEGDKLYAATGLGWDDPALGWHHCPPGMGIYNDVYVEFRNREHISDVFVRPIVSGNRAEAWIEIENTEYIPKNPAFRISVYGQNFKETVIENRTFSPKTIHTVGLGDSLTEADVKDILGTEVEAPALHGKNLYKFSIPMENPKLWELDKPYLYQLQVELLIGDNVTDCRCCQFGMREFKQDLSEKPYGMFYLNGRKIRLRGANTMGFEQLDVMNGDYEQLIEDILLAKICNMNYWRLTQRPVQKQVYEYCDKLGLMTQTDLPIFGCVRRPMVCEALRQTEEMERLIRNHPCNVVVSYINEPFPNANNKPHRHLTRPEMEEFFAACDFIVHMHNPDRVIKHVDGDYDPPTEGMPDNHCYPMWYNGHGIDAGRLHKGYWIPVKPDWYYGCGEYGAEGLECSEVMKKYYPGEWLAEPFNPGNIINAQTADMHRFFYDTPGSMEEWISKSQSYQAFATKLMTEAFRRNKNMISNAIHLFIDAWPSGWMKTIMDCERHPKEAYFAYRNALEPVMISLRTDRFTYYVGEEVSIEAFLCNDTNISGDGYTVHYELYSGDDVIYSGMDNVTPSDCDVTVVSTVKFSAPEVNNRQKYTLKAILLNDKGDVITYNTQEIEVFQPVEIKESDNVALITELDTGVHEIAGEKVEVKNCGMLPLHFVSRNTGHETVSEFEEKDFSYWYDKKADMITPLLYKTFTAEGFTPVLTTGNKDSKGAWGEAFAAAVKEYEGKIYVICLVPLRRENPVADRFLHNVYEYGRRKRGV